MLAFAFDQPGCECRELFRASGSCCGLTAYRGVQRHEAPSLFIIFIVLLLTLSEPSVQRFQHARRIFEGPCAEAAGQVRENPCLPAPHFQERLSPFCREQDERGTTVSCVVLKLDQTRRQKRIDIDLDVLARNTLFTSNRGHGLSAVVAQSLQNPAHRHSDPEIPMQLLSNALEAIESKANRDDQSVQLVDF